MKITFLTENFYPEINASANRALITTQRLALNNYKVSVITCNPNFPDGVIYKGYKNKFFQKEKISEVNVYRIWSFLYPNKGFYIRIFDQITFFLNSILCSFFIGRQKYIIATSPQFLVLISGYIISLFKGSKFISEIRDLWPDTPKEMGVIKSKLLYKFLKKIEFFIYKKSYKIIVVTKSFENYLIKNNIPKKKIVLIPNRVNLTKSIIQTTNTNLIEKYDLKDKIVFGYVGTIGMAHNIKTIIKAFEIIDINLSNKCKFLIIGKGAEYEQLFNYTKNKKINNVQFCGLINKDELLSYWSVIDISIIHLRKIDIFKTVIPSKLIESISFDKPVISGVYGESAEIIENNNLGIVFEPENHLVLKNIIEDIVSKKIDIKSFKDSCSSYKKNFSIDKSIEMYKTLFK